VGDFWRFAVLALPPVASRLRRLVVESRQPVIGAMITAPLMTPILGVVLGVVLTDRANLGRCLLLLAAGAAAVVAVSWLLGQATCRRWPSTGPTTRAGQWLASSPRVTGCW
jgi:hypothetical protein